MLVFVFIFLQIFMMSDDDDLDFASTNKRFLDFINKKNQIKIFFF
jgi:hypothetical protein